MPDPATAALIRKRAELAGEIETRATTLDQLRANLAHLDAAIRIMCPAAEPELSGGFVRQQRVRSSQG